MHIYLTDCSCNHKPSIHTVDMFKNWTYKGSSTEEHYTEFASYHMNDIKVHGSHGYIT